MQKYIARLLLPVLLLVCLPLSAFCQEGVYDSLSIGTVNAKAGELVQLPVTLVDELKTPLGVDAGAGHQIQSIAVKVYCQPPEYVSAISLTRSGALAGLTPLYESTQSFGNSSTESPSPAARL